MQRECSSIPWLALYAVLHEDAGYDEQSNLYRTLSGLDSPRAFVVSSTDSVLDDALYTEPLISSAPEKPPGNGVWLNESFIICCGIDIGNI